MLYRDFRFIVGFAMQIMMYAADVVRPAHALPAESCLPIPLPWSSRPAQAAR